MDTIRKTIVALLSLPLLILAANSCQAVSTADQPAEVHTGNDSTHHALFVGCTRYPYLEEKWWLEGPANDVALLEKVLTGERFGVHPSRITKLVGWPAEEKARPTKRNIKEAFKQLAKKVKRGEEVIIFLAGHGSQQPAGPSSVEEEADGMDEIFLPADVRNWDGKKRGVRNAITDNEIRDWLAAIRKKGASVWFIADSCNSGTITRGAPLEEERERRLPPEALIPSEALAEARGARQAQSRGSASTVESSVLELDDSSGDLVAMYAAQPHEITPELPLPGAGDPYHGLFSYVIAEILSSSASALTYRELTDRVASQYRALGRAHPTPILEGGGLDREVLGVREWPGRSPFLLVGRDEKTGLYRLNAGDLHGLSSGSVLAVYPPAGSEKSAQTVGHVRIVRTEALESLVEPFRYNDTKAPNASALPVDSRCSIVYVDYGKMQLFVALQSDDESGSSVVTFPPGKGPPVLETAMRKIEKSPGKLVKRVSDPAQADWFVRRVGDRILLIPRSGWMQNTPPRYFVGSLDQTQAIPQELTNALQKIARARHLLRLAESDATDASASRQLELSLELLVESGQGSAAVPYGSNGRVLHKDDRVKFRVTNLGSHAVDVTILFVNSGSGIMSILPKAGSREFNRIRPDESKTSETWTVVDDTVGPEQAIAIGVRGTGPLVDLSYLEQPTLARGRPRGLPRGSGQALRLLLDSAAGNETSRGLAFSDVEDFVVELVGWTVSADR